jgi:hypothetical protein
MSLFPAKVNLNEETHEYTDSAGNYYMSFSECYEFLAPRFDANKIAYFTGGKNQEGMEKTLAKWDEQRSEGVRVDAALTHYLKHDEIPAEFNDIQLAVLELSVMYGAYAKKFPQTILYCEEFRTAGTTDTLCLTTNRKDSQIVLSDTKCYENMEDDLYKGRGWLFAPFDHLPNSKFMKTAFQLSYYGYHAEKLTGKKIKELFIHLIQPSTCRVGKVNHKKIHVPYLKHDVMALLELNKDKIKEKLLQKSILI